MKINLKDFLPRMRRSEKFTSLKGFVPALRCIKFDGNRLKAMDGIRGILIETEYKLFDSFLLPADVLSTVVSNLNPESDIQFDSVDQPFVTIKQGKFKTEIAKVQEKGFNFPSIPLDGEPLPENFLSNVKQVHFAVSKDETKPQLRGVFIDGSSYYGTDNTRMARFTSDFRLNLNFILPDILLELLSWEEPPVAYSFMEDGKFWLWYEKHLVFVELIKKAFPPCKKIFDGYLSNGEPPYCVFDKPTMTAALNRVEPFCFGVHKIMEVTVEPNKIILKAANNFGNVEDEIICENGGNWTFKTGLEDLRSCTERMGRFSFMNDVVYFNQDNLECLLLTQK